MQLDKLAYIHNKCQSGPFQYDVRKHSYGQALICRNKIIFKLAYSAIIDLDNKALLPEFKCDC